MMFVLRMTLKSNVDDVGNALRCACLYVHGEVQVMWVFNWRKAEVAAGD